MSDNFEIRSPATKEEWKRYDDFRWEVLRKPLKMSLNARENAVSFYKSLGYFEAGPYESDIQIPHTRMEKLIS